MFLSPDLPLSSPCPRCPIRSFIHAIRCISSSSQFVLNHNTPLNFTSFPISHYLHGRQSRHQLGLPKRPNSTTQQQRPPLPPPWLDPLPAEGPRGEVLVDEPLVVGPERLHVQRVALVLPKNKVCCLKPVSPSSRPEGQTTSRRRPTLVYRSNLLNSLTQCSISASPGAMKRWYSPWSCHG